MKGESFHKVILIDANFLVALLDHKSSKSDKERVAHFIAQVEKHRSLVIIPTPAIAEYLVRADLAGIESLKVLRKRAHVKVGDFDTRAAYENALLDRGALNIGDKRDGVAAPWQKIKIDRQIVAIGKVEAATMVVTADDGVRGNAIRVNMEAMSIKELPLPPGQSKLQLKLPKVPKKAANKKTSRPAGPSKDGESAA